MGGVNGFEAQVKGRPEGVDLGEYQPVGLDIELPRDRQKRLAAKKSCANLPCVTSEPKAVATSIVDASSNPNTVVGVTGPPREDRHKFAADLPNQNPLWRIELPTIRPSF